MTLSDRLQSLAAGSNKATEPDDGREYVEESKGFSGSKFLCNLCHVILDQSQKDAHVRDNKHKEAYKAMKEKASVEEQLVLAKHESLSPTEEEFQAVRDIVLSCEKALKLVSDSFVPKQEKMEVAGDKEASSDKDGGEQPAAELPPRSIKGVMRAGLLANGLLMKGEVKVHLVLLSTDKSTVTLLSHVADVLPQQLATVTEEKYSIVMSPTEACIYVTADKSPKALCKISLTSPLMRRHPFEHYNEIAPPDPADVLPHRVCEDSLRELRRARWFESKAYMLPFCEVVMRVFRDLCNRVPTWTLLDIWLLELIVQKCLSTLESNATATSAVQRVFECIAGGILLPDSPGIYDPCEREPTDLCTKMTMQEREDITASAQHALRLTAFHQMHKILDMMMDDLSADGKSGNKRRRSEADATDFALPDKKDRLDIGSK